VYIQVLVATIKVQGQPWCTLREYIYILTNLVRLLTKQPESLTGEPAWRPWDKGYLRTSGSLNGATSTWGCTRQDRGPDGQVQGHVVSAGAKRARWNNNNRFKGFLCSQIINVFKSLVTFKFKYAAWPLYPSRQENKNKNKIKTKVSEIFLHPVKLFATTRSTREDWRCVDPRGKTGS